MARQFLLAIFVILFNVIFYPATALAEAKYSIKEMTPSPGGVGQPPGSV